MMDNCILPDILCRLLGKVPKKMCRPCPGSTHIKGSVITGGLDVRQRQW